MFSGDYDICTSAINELNITMFLYIVVQGFGDCQFSVQKCTQITSSEWDQIVADFPIFIPKSKRLFENVQYTLLLKQVFILNLEMFLLLLPFKIPHKCQG